MRRTYMLWGAVIMLAALAVVKAGAQGEKEAAPAAPPISIPPEAVAEYIHAVIEAERTFYTVHVVERLQAKGVVVASQNWRKANTLPLPVQFLMESAQLAKTTGAKVQYRLISLLPINPANGPSTPFEQAGLQAVLKNPDRPYTGVVTEHGKQFFQAIYADRAVSQSCIGCHNAQPGAPKKYYRLNEIMGGILIAFPLPEDAKH
jgi:Protein of unknown function (DUF3365)